MSEVKWIKIVTDVFDDEKMLLIESLPSADSIIVIWFKLLCLAGKNNNSGVFMLNERIAYTDEMLATIFRRDVNTVRLALKTFEMYGMIEVINDVITIPNWSKHQTLDQLEERKEYMKDYMKKYRAKQKALSESKPNGKVNSKVNVNSLEEEREEEKEGDKDKNIKKEKKKSEFDLIIETYTDDLQLRNTIYEFIKMRKAIKAPMTSNALNLMLKKLDKLAHNDVFGDERIAILEQSIMNSWKGIFELKETSSSNKKSNFGDSMRKLYEEAVIEDEENGTCANNDNTWF
ncbi:phage replisome organizer N-terminal domain-containing protein [Clostridium nigeriense]|uniref:phage replisome organizer N-terminal domain-containing protein n=1 Tax=Clostridium nigeriense TaxID=1805470 RepID=UPI003D34CFA1